MAAHRARLVLACSREMPLFCRTEGCPKTFINARRGYATASAPIDAPRSRLFARRTNNIYPVEEDIDRPRGWQRPEMRVRDRVVEMYAEARANKSAKWITVSPRWLRDHCTCAACFNQATGQRQINVLKGGINCEIQDIAESDETIHLTFKDGHHTTMSKDFIVGRDPGRSKLRHGMIEPHLWNATVENGPPSVQYRDCEAEGPGQLLRNIRTHGFCFVEGTPPTPEATQSLLEAIGPIRNTHYGGFYDFTSNLQSKDTAYTAESLEPHTDNTYFTEPAGLQALHLLSHTDGSGGESSLVDGFRAASQLFSQDRMAYGRLATTGVYGHASGNDGISIQPDRAYPVLNHHPEIGSLMQVRWNNADRAGFFSGMPSIDEWYDSASKFDALLNDPRNVFEFQLTPGKLLIFDNWRVLHGRAAFTGKRRMCGGYINRDDFISKFRQTNMSREEIRASTVTG